ncbi:hypothetical protein LY78DRAFT_282786 [Colletotrichum sublineola]|nr:hypothetical protein LY78DRAFT_282786 [Colletotrichum sublineola]
MPCILLSFCSRPETSASPSARRDGIISPDTMHQGLLWRQGWRDGQMVRNTVGAAVTADDSVRLSLTSEGNPLEGIGFSGKDRCARAASRAICRYVGLASVKTTRLWLAVYVWEMCGSSLSRARQRGFGGLVEGWPGGNAWYNQTRFLFMVAWPTISLAKRCWRPFGRRLLLFLSLCPTFGGTR